MNVYIYIYIYINQLIKRKTKLIFSLLRNSLSIYIHNYYRDEENSNEVEKQDNDKETYL